MSTVNTAPSPLRFITCGSVDDGKSTLIGRLLYESHCIFEDQLAALKKDSEKFGTQGKDVDFALLVDGLQAEREQGITIDVAYRFFSTPSRKFIVADTPGHEQYTRNMATGASTADLAVVLVDARKGLLTQTRRHTRIVAMMGIRHVILVVNKIDLVQFDQAVTAKIESEYRAFCQQFAFASLHAIPISALLGNNVIAKGNHMPWYHGPALMDVLNTLNIQAECGDAPHLLAAFRMPVQRINRTSPDFRGVCGRVAQGTVRVGDAVRALPAGTAGRIKEIMVGQDRKSLGQAGESVTLILDTDIDTSRGDVIASADNLPEISDQFEARLLWMSASAMIPGRAYFCKLHSKEVTATVTAIKYCEDVDTGAHLAATTLEMNVIAMANLSLSQAVVFEPYARNRQLGGFILIDKLTMETVGAGMLQFGLHRSANLRWQTLEINKQSRAVAKQQVPRCIWFTGLSGSGKSTIANLLEQGLHGEGKHTYLLDGDNVRHGLNRDLGFTTTDRVENIRRIAEVAKLMVDAGLIVLVSLISPFRSEREMARGLFDEGEFIEVFVDTPLDICELRDPKGLYAKARNGALKNFTGVDSAYEPPVSPDIHLTAGTLDAASCASIVRQRLREISLHQTRD